MRQYCSVCKAQFDMTVVSEAGDDGVVWLKCPQCAGILPHMPAEDDPAPSRPSSERPKSTTAEEPEPEHEIPPSVVEEIDPDDARIYSPHESYEVGDVVHHRGWNDYGRVVAKESLPGNRTMIRVRFVQNGEVQLIEGGGA